MPPGANFMPPPMGAPDMPAPPMMGGPPGVYKNVYYSSKKSYDLHNIVLNGKKSLHIYCYIREAAVTCI